MQNFVIHYQVTISFLKKELSLSYIATQPLGERVLTVEEWWGGVRGKREDCSKMPHQIVFSTFLLCHVHSVCSGATRFLELLKNWFSNT